jgi:hypothetical protein
MFHVLGQDETLAGRDLIPPVADLIEPMTIHTIKEKIFRQAFLPVGIVVSSPWIIAKPADIELAQENIVLDAGF